MMGIMWGSLSATDQGAGQVDPRGIRLHRQADHEIAMVLVEFELGRAASHFPAWLD